MSGKRSYTIERRASQQLHNCEISHGGFSALPTRLSPGSFLVWTGHLCRGLLPIFILEVSRYQIPQSDMHAQRHGLL